MLVKHLSACVPLAFHPIDKTDDYYNAQSKADDLAVNVGMLSPLIIILNFWHKISIETCTCIEFSSFFRGHHHWLQLDRKVLEHEFPKKSGPIVLYFAVRYVMHVSYNLSLDKSKQAYPEQTEVYTWTEMCTVLIHKVYRKVYSCFSSISTPHNPPLCLEVYHKSTPQIYQECTWCTAACSGYQGVGGGNLLECFTLPAEDYFGI